MSAITDESIADVLTPDERIRFLEGEIKKALGKIDELCAALYDQDKMKQAIVLLEGNEASLRERFLEAVADAEHQKRLVDESRADARHLASILRQEEEELVEARAEAIKWKRLENEAAEYVEMPIVMRTHFTGEEPYVGWKGIGLALTEALDQRDRLKEAIEQMLDDMEEDGFCVCPEAKSQALDALDGVGVRTKHFPDSSTPQIDAREFAGHKWQGEGIVEN